MMPNTVYTVHTNLDPQALSAVGLEVFRMWIAFAAGQETLNGFRIENPTGRYAASIEYKQVGEAQVSIVQHEDVAPEGAFLEEGTKEIDMLAAGSPWVGRRIPMHRGRPGQFGSQGNSVPKNSPGTIKQARKMKHIWVEARGDSGSVLVPRSRAEVRPGARNTSGTGPAWTIPAMPAYSPAGTLADLAARYAAFGGG
jgi:hypothetical protein